MDIGDESLRPPDVGDLDNDGNDGEDTPLDLDLNSRVINGGDAVEIDMGAYELAPSGSCPADLDENGLVNGPDLATVLGQWSGSSTYSPCPPYKPEDLNQDCKVNGFDLGLLLGAWGACPGCR